MMDFAESVVSHDSTSIMNLMANIHSMVAPDAPPLRKVSEFIRKICNHSIVQFVCLWKVVTKTRTSTVIVHVEQFPTEQFEPWI